MGSFISKMFLGMVLAVAAAATLTVSVANASEACDYQDNVEFQFVEFGKVIDTTFAEENILTIDH